MRHKKFYPIVYARTGADECDPSFAIPLDWMRWHPTCRHADPKLWEYVRSFLDKKVIYQSWLFYLCGHSFEFDREDNWERMEEFARQMGGRPEIWYATNLEIHDYVEAYRSLRFSAVGTRVQNPSSVAVWFRADGVDEVIGPGEQKELKRER